MTNKRHTKCHFPSSFNSRSTPSPPFFILFSVHFLCYCCCAVLLTFMCYIVLTSVPWINAYIFATICFTVFYFSFLFGRVCVSISCTNLHAFLLINKTFSLFFLLFAQLKIVCSFTVLPFSRCKWLAKLLYYFPPHIVHATCYQFGHQYIENTNRRRTRVGVCVCGLCIY